MSEVPEVPVGTQTEGGLYEPPSIYVQNVAFTPTNLEDCALLGEVFGDTSVPVTSTHEITGEDFTLHVIVEVYQDGEKVGRGDEVVKMPATIAESWYEWA